MQVAAYRLDHLTTTVPEVYLLCGQLCCTRYLRDCCTGANLDVNNYKLTISTLQPLTYVRHRRHTTELFTELSEIRNTPTYSSELAAYAMRRPLDSCTFHSFPFPVACVSVPNACTSTTSLQPKLIIIIYDDM